MLNLKPDNFVKPLNTFMKNNVFAVLAVSPIYAYADKKRTDTVIGTRYTVANPDTFANFEVRVNNPTPVVTQDEIVAAEEAEERFWITFTNATVRPSKIEFGEVLCVVTADSAKLES